MGHSDVLLGSITVATPAEWERVRLGSLQLGQYASPDDCWLALRLEAVLREEVEKRAVHIS